MHTHTERERERERSQCVPFQSRASLCTPTSSVRIGAPRTRFFHNHGDADTLRQRLHTCAAVARSLVLRNEKINIRVSADTLPIRNVSCVDATSNSDATAMLTVSAATLGVDVSRLTLVPFGNCASISSRRSHLVPTRAIHCGGISY
jgi:hypothetical protein